jgi:hypothetical protein
MRQRGVGLHAQQGDVGLRIGPDDAGLQLAPVGQLDGDALGLPDDVVVGHHEALRIDDEAAALAHGARLTGLRLALAAPEAPEELLEGRPAELGWELGHLRGLDAAGDGHAHHRRGDAAHQIGEARGHGGGTGRGGRGGAPLGGLLLGGGRLRGGAQRQRGDQARGKGAGTRGRGVRPAAAPGMVRHGGRLLSARRRLDEWSNPGVRCWLPPASTAEFLRAEVARWERVVREAGIRAE